MAKFDWNETKRQIIESQAWQSIFRHGYEDTPRNRILMVSGNIWLHLHPSKVQKHTVRLRFTWCMGGITFLLFMVTVITGSQLNGTMPGTDMSVTAWPLLLVQTVPGCRVQVSDEGTNGEFDSWRY